MPELFAAKHNRWYIILETYYASVYTCNGIDMYAFCTRFLSRVNFLFLVVAFEYRRLLQRLPLSFFPSHCHL